MQAACHGASLCRLQACESSGRVFLGLRATVSTTKPNQDTVAMKLKQQFQATSAVSGVATVDLSEYPQACELQFTVIPISASGTGAVTYKPAGTSEVEPGYEPLCWPGGNTPIQIDLSSQKTLPVRFQIAGLKITSDNPVDSFTVIGG